MLKKIPLRGWALIVIIAVTMAIALIFKPDFTPTQSIIAFVVIVNLIVASQLLLKNK